MSSEERHYRFECLRLVVGGHGVQPAQADNVIAAAEAMMRFVVHGDHKAVSDKNYDRQA
jgi:hypothetical protein